VKNRADVPKQINIWRIVTAGAILLLIALYVAIPAVHARISGWIMVYTQHSVQSVAGAIQHAGSLAPLTALALCAFQTIALPWLLPYGIGGNVLVFGGAVGVLISVFGALLGASAWYGLARLFLGDVLRHKETLGSKHTHWISIFLIVALNWLTLGMLCVPAALAGVGRLTYRSFLLSAFVAELPIVILYAAFCNPYRALLPNAVEASVRILGMFVVGITVAIALVSRQKHRADRQDEADSGTSEK